MKPKVTQQDALAEADEAFTLKPLSPDEWTAPDKAKKWGCGRDTALGRIRKLQEQGLLSGPITRRRPNGQTVLAWTPVPQK